MNRTTHFALPALALAGVLALSACGNSGETAGMGSSASPHGSGHTDSATDSAKGNDADVAFLAGMIPHHAQAVEMSDIVLTKNPPAEVVAIARQIKDAQAPEIEQMNGMLTDLGESTDPAEHTEHGSSHSGMMSEDDLAALEDATGADASKLYVSAMIEHHRGAIEASDTEIADGKHGPAIALAKEIKQAQTAEIAELETLLSSL